MIRKYINHKPQFRYKNIPHSKNNYVNKIRLVRNYCNFACFLFKHLVLVSLFVFVALRPMSTAMVIAGRLVHLTTLFPGQA